MPKIRQATTSDIPALVPLVRQYWTFEHLEGFDAGRIAEGLTRLLSTAHLGNGWIARADGEPAGYLLAVYVFSLEHLGLTAEIDEFFVLPEYRGKGIGDSLLAAAEQQFIAKGCTNSSLQIGRDNAVARRFYHRHGYTDRDDFDLLDKTLIEP